VKVLSFPRAKQHGIALIGLLVLLTLGASWWLVSALGNPVNRTASDREHNARVLQQARLALIGSVGLIAGNTTENNPGRLPCPEAPGAANNYAGGVYAEADDGVAAGNCLLPAVGRLPWRTLGIDKLLDASGEPLWYVVSPAWALSNATLPPLQTLINSDNAAGQLTLDGAGDIVALIIAPGRPLDSRGPACVAGIQARLRQPNVNWNPCDFLDGGNVDGDTTFTSSDPANPFNDQIVAVTSGDVLPVIEAAIANRFVKQFGSSMRYCDGLWAPCTGAGAAAYYPFAADFTTLAAGTFQGMVDNAQGLLPLSFSGAGPCLANTPAAPYCAPPPACGAAPYDGPRCAPTLITYRNNPVITSTGGATIRNYSCSVGGTPSTLTCTVNTSSGAGLVAADRWMTFTMDVTSNNVGMAVRTINTAAQMTGVDTAIATAVNYPYGYSMTSAALNADGSATVRINSRVPGVSGGLISDLLCALTLLESLLLNCYQHTITVPFMWLDQPMLYADNATMAWFYRNGWHERMYYAVSAGNAPSGTGTCAGATCLSVNGPTLTNIQRALVLTPGRAVGAQPRPPVVIADWLEGGNADLDTQFWARDPALPVNRAFNDHVVAIDSN
jgi:hypothetical protein